MTAGSTTSTDVVVIGGGPGGSTCSAQLARRGLGAIVLEKTTFPRFHLGESLLPQSMPILQELGIYDKLLATFIPKYGARFHDDLGGRHERFDFSSAWRPIEHAFEVPRDELDHMLLEHARSLGADVRMRWKAEQVVFDERGRAAGVEAIGPNGERERILARFVVDASGRDAVMAHRERSTTKIPGLDQTALYAHFTGVPRQAGKLAGDIDIVMFPSVEAHRPNWFWFIPFKDGRTSVGAVVSLAWMREEKAKLPAGADVASALFERAVAVSPTAGELLAGARCCWPAKEATADFSYRVSSMVGHGWLAVGDAGGFIDPLFSTGAHIAIVGGKLAADAIADALARPDDEPALALEWEKRVRAGAETFILAVRAFYSGPLVELLFAPDKHSVLRRSITALLAGDVFHDARWLRDTRARLAEMVAES